MCRLSIITLYTGEVASFEATLASVLRHQPAGSELFVAQTQEYADTHDIASEAYLLEPISTAVDALNDALERCRGEVVHILLAGTDVTENWCESVLSLFDENGQLGSISPVMVNAAEKTKALSAGVRYAANGSRVEVHSGERMRKVRNLTSFDSLGPALNGAFYRMSALEDIGGFEPAVGASLCDIDAAILLGHAGYTTSVDPDCEIKTSITTLPSTSYEAGYFGEQLFRRHASGAFGESVSRNFANAISLLTGGIMQFFGRWAASRQAVIEIPAFEPAYSEVVRFEDEQRELPGKNVAASTQTRRAA